LALVLAIEPDPRQAAIVKRIVREKVFADVTVVDSRDAALEAMRTAVPDVLLLSALLSPRDEDELIAFLRTLDGADHLQTHTIPQLASTLGPGEGRAARGLLSAFRRKKEPEEQSTGCDPDVFAEEILSYVQRAADKKREHIEAMANMPANAVPQDNAWRTATHHADRVAAPIAEEAAAEEESSSSWSSPFEWKPSNPSSLISNPYSRILTPDEAMEAAEAQLAQAAAETTEPAPVAAEYEPDAVEPVWTSAEVAEDDEPVGIEEPVHLETAPYEEASVDIEPPSADVETPDYIDAPTHIEEPIHVAAAVRETHPHADSGSAPRPAGFPVRDIGSAIREQRLGLLANWLRTERPTASTSASADDLRALLGGLAVPQAIAAVGYPRGVRIRRVRVPATREAKPADAAGAVILSKKLLAEQRAGRA
jgi:CheY-like chemotaxis protein